MLGEHFFRHEYGRLVATLSRQVGVHNIEVVEDAVQSALMSALTAWTASGLPDRPSAWLFRVARNELMGELRKQSGRRRLLEQDASTHIETPADVSDIFISTEMRDDLLRMSFICCDEAIPQESQLVLALKTLCGFDTREIAIRLFTSEANVYKRLGRARSRLQTLPFGEGELGGEQYASRVPAVHKILYLLFTEGYLASDAVTSIRRELCNEAIRLADVPFQETRWDRVVECYALLERGAPSALHRLNRAVAVAEWQGPSAGIAVLEGFEPPTWLAGSYLWSAVLADLHRRSGNAESAERYRDVALQSAPTAAVRTLLERRPQTS